MSTNHTANYNLNQWEAEDRVLRTEFNEDNAKIDAAIKAVDVKADKKADSTTLDAQVATLNDRISSVAATVPRVAVGTYAGSGAKTRQIMVGFTPKAVLLFNSLGYGYLYETVYNQYHYGGLAVTGGDVISKDNDVVLSIITGGFRVAFDNTDNPHIWTNGEGYTYHYIAIG